MKRATKTRPGPQRLAYLAVALTVLSGCDEALLTSEKPDDSEGKTELLPEVSSGSQRDVEAPDVFEVTEAGLWDGRPSLGGIWVAHPDVTQPERVVIKNTSNNKSVTGALFRRERALPGPALQVSSAAAEELGMLAGAPTKINVVALRREVIEETPPPAAEPEEEPVEVAEDATAEAPAEPEAQEEAPPKRKWWQKKQPAATAAAATGAAVAAADDAAEPVVEAATEAAPEEIASAAAPGLSDAPVEPPAAKPEKRKWWQKKAPEEITETPLDPISGAAAAIDASEPVAATAATAAAASASSLSKPFVQVGTFSVEVNANSAAEKIRQNGMVASVRALETANNTVWRVLVGPAATREERKTIQKNVKDLGFGDAFNVSN